MAMGKDREGKRAGTGKYALILSAALILTVVMFFAILCLGAVEIPVGDTFKILFGGTPAKSHWQTIILDVRLPMAICATVCGATLSVAGLMMQTVFHNPLAGPSVLGVTSGASLGVAVLLLGTGYMGLNAGAVGVSLAGALAGAALVIVILLGFSSILSNGVMLLIVGIMISYLCSSAISLLNYFAPAEGMRSYLVWGLGSYGGLTIPSALWLAIISGVFLIISVFYIKPLNALLLGERYAGSVGYSPRKTRSWLLVISGILIAVPTAFCGPIGFIGLVTPHLCRLFLKSSNHSVILPASMVFGALISLGCTILSVMPSARFGILPVNVITPLIGVPVIIWLLVKRDKIVYFQ